MLLSLIKKIFKIESIFIYTALAIFFCTIFFKRASNNLIQKLDTEMLLLQMDPKSIVAGSDSADIFSKSPTDFESIALKLRSDYQAFTYFDAPLKKELEAIIQNIQSGNRNTDAIISFQNHIHEVQTRLNLGYDSLLYSALFLIAIAAFIILEKFFKNSMQLKQLKTMQTEQSNFSRDLHDGVAQNLAALNIYLEDVAGYIRSADTFLFAKILIVLSISLLYDIRMNIKERKMTWRTYLAYGGGDLYGGGCFFIVTTFSMYYLVNVIGLHPALAGLIPAIGKVWDAVPDPMMGYISDNTPRTRFGKRRV